MARQLTLKELLNDQVYARWIVREPTITVVGQTQPGAIYAQKKKKGPWTRALVWEYSTALKWMQDHMDEYHDIVINSRRQAFKPPVVKSRGVRHFWPNPAGHIWCVYCRRPTRFRYFERHHALPPSFPLATYEKRCSVCGVRLEGIKQFSSKLVSTLEVKADKPDKRKKKKHGN